MNPNKFTIDWYKDEITSYSIKSYWIYSAFHKHIPQLLALPLWYLLELENEKPNRNVIIDAQKCMNMDDHYFTRVDNFNTWVNGYGFASISVKFSNAKCRKAAICRLANRELEEISPPIDGVCGMQIQLNKPDDF